MDLAIFQTLNSLAGHGAFWDGVIIFCAQYLPYLLGIAFIMVGLWPVRRVRMVVSAFLAGAIGVGLIRKVVVLLYQRPRPFIDMPSVHRLISSKGQEYASFPSGHAFFFFAAAMVVYRYNRQLGHWFLVGATIISIARVIAGVHWPTDVLAGAALGVIVAELITRFVPALRPTSHA